MKLHATITLLIFYSCLAWTMANVQYKGYTNSNSLKRQVGGKSHVYVSPEQLPSPKSYIRPKREMPQLESILEFQNMLLNTKNICMKELGSKARSDEPLIYKKNPTQTDKCVIECLFKRIGIMDENNRLSPNNIANIADIMSQNNALVRSIVLATAENCNRRITASEKCEAAYQISRCIANEMQAHKIKLIY